VKLSGMERISAAARRAGVGIAVGLPSGPPLELGPRPPAATVRFVTRRALSRTLAEGFLGFGEAYMDGEIEVEGDWDALLAVGFHAGLDAARPGLGGRLRFAAFRVLTANRRRRARRNIAHHYDRGEAFYRLWLDDTMTYSCAFFRTPGDTLEAAQRAKLERISRKLALEPGMTLLDVGCGWGSLVLHAAREHGVRAVGITLSENQATTARRRVAEAGLGERVEIRLQDWREVEGRFDRWVSVGMAEHVGRRYLGRFARHIARVLRPGGVGLLHLIGKDRRLPGDPWTLTYIFPGGYLPGLPEVTEHLARAGMVVADVENLRAHYALTLDRWRERFERHVDDIRAMFDERFVRMWRLFLVSSAAGFRHGSIRVWQVLFTHGLSDELPLLREALLRPAPP